MKNCFIDIETGGFSATKNPLLQLALIMDTDGKLDEKSWRVRPFPEDEIDDEALAVNGMTREEIATFPEPAVVLQEMEVWLGGHIHIRNHISVSADVDDRACLIGYNVGFDAKFLSAFFEKCARFNSCDPELTCTIFADWFMETYDLLKLAKKTLPSVENYKMITVAKALGMTIDEESIHEAVCDVRIAREIYVAMCGENQ